MRIPPLRLVPSPQTIVLLAVAAALALAGAGCLPRGEPPAGRQLLAERQITISAIVPPNGDGSLRVLFLRPGKQDPRGRDLYLLSVDPAAGAPTERLLAEDLFAGEDLGCLHMVAPCWKISPTGVLFLGRREGVDFYLDALTGERLTSSDGSVAASSGGQWSASKRRLLVTQGDAAEVIEPGNRRTPLERLAWGEFAGEDLFYLQGGTGDLHRLAESGEDTLIASEVVDWRAWATTAGPFLIINREDPEPAPMDLPVRSPRARTDYFPLSFVRDPASGKELSLPFNGLEDGIAPSPDGRWLVRTPSGAFGARPEIPARITFFDFRTGAQRLVEIPAVADLFFWRPGRDEVWVSGRAEDEAPGLWVVREGVLMDELRGVFFHGFSDDGAYWSSSPHGAELVQVGSADALKGPRVDLPPGVGIDFRSRLQDGRFLGAIGNKNWQRPDIYAIDVRSGEVELLAARGKVAALGKNRLVGLLHFADGHGDLTAVALDSRRQTVLAAEYAITAFVEPEGTAPDDDLAAPGARVVYQFRSRAASAYDGLWLAELP